jgi:hypothetical protein
MEGIYPRHEFDMGGYSPPPPFINLQGNKVFWEKIFSGFENLIT